MKKLCDSCKGKKWCYWKQLMDNWEKVGIARLVPEWCSRYDSERKEEKCDPSSHTTGN